ncbi:unnamed protein product, partial [Owenia fusiformis]
MNSKMTFWSFVLTFCGIVGFHCCLAGEYGIVIDAGSSGSRARIYTWPERTSLSQTIQLTEVGNKKIKPGLSAFVGDANGIRDHVLQLIDACKDNVPDDKQVDTPIYVMATAGMRLLKGTDAFAIYEKVDEFLSDKSFSPFDFQKGNARTLSGEEEGAFTWIAANQLNGLFGKGRTTNETVGIIEMGGASTQLAFVPRGNLLADKFPVFVAGKHYPLYVHSYLYYGQDFGIQKIKNNLYRNRPDGASNVIINPCMLVGDDKLIDMQGVEIQYQGSGNPDECLNLIRDELVYKSPDHRCFPKPCSIGPVYQPEIPAGMLFYAVSAIIHTSKTIGATSADNGMTNAGTILAESREFCQLDLQTALNKTGDSYSDARCLSGLLISTMMIEGWGFDKDE